MTSEKLAVQMSRVIALKLQSHSDGCFSAVHPGHPMVEKKNNHSFTYIFSATIDIVSNVNVNEVGTTIYCS